MPTRRFSTPCSSYGGVSRADYIYSPLVSATHQRHSSAPLISAIRSLRNRLVTAATTDGRYSSAPRYASNMHQRHTTASAPWAGSPEGADAAIAYATAIDDDAAKDGFCYSAVANRQTATHAPHPPHILNIAVDSGATWHLHGRRGDLTDFRPCGDSIAGIDGFVQRCQLPRHGHPRSTRPKSSRSDRGTQDPERAPSSTVEPEPSIRFAAPS